MLFNPSPAPPPAETAGRTGRWRAFWLPARAALSAAPCARRSPRAATTSSPGCAVPDAQAAPAGAESLAARRHRAGPRLVGRAARRSTSSSIWRSARIAPPSRSILDAEPDAAAGAGCGQPRARGTAVCLCQLDQGDGRDDRARTGRSVRRTCHVPEDAYGRAKLATERRACAVAAETGSNSSVLRPPLVYGPGVGGNFRALLRLAGAACRCRSPRLDNRRSLIARDNLVDLIAACCAHPSRCPGRPARPAGPRRHDLSTPELIRILAAAQGRNGNLFALPKPVFAGLRRLPLLGAAFRRLTLSLQIDDAADPGGAGLAAPGGGRGGAGRNRPRFRGGVNCGGIDRRAVTRSSCFRISRDRRGLSAPAGPASVAVCGVFPATNFVQHMIPRHIRLTSHPGSGRSRRQSRCAGARPAPSERGPVVASPAEPRHRNAIGSYSGSYAVYRALAVATRALARDHRPDLTDTAPAALIGPRPQWADPKKIVSLDPYGPSRRRGLRRADPRRHRRPPDDRDHRGRISTCRRSASASPTGDIVPDGRVLLDKRRDPRHQGGDRPGLAPARPRRAVRRRRSRTAAHACSRKPAGCSPSW